MDNFKKYREDAVERSNIVDSVINEAKEVAQRHFASSEYSVMTAEKLQHERDRDEKGVLNLLDGYKAHLVSTLKAACESVFSIDDDGEVVNDHLNNSLNRLKLRRYFSLSKDLPAIDTRHGNEEGVVKFLYPLLPKVYVSAADKRANPKVQTVAHPFSQSTVQTALYTAYEKLRHEVNISGKEGRVENPLRFFQDRVSTATSPGDKSLAKLAVRALVAPVSSVAAERGGSFLRKLSEPDRRRMGDKAMEDNMLLRNNRVYVDRLLSAALNRCRMDAPRPAPTPSDDTTESSAVSEEKMEKDNPEAARRAKAREKRKEEPKVKEAMKQIVGQRSISQFLKKGNSNDLKEHMDKEEEEEEEEEEGEEEEKEGEEEEEEEETKTPMKHTHTFSTSSRKSGKNKRHRRHIED